MKALQVNYVDGKYVKTVVETYDPTWRSNELSRKDACIILDRLRTIQSRKDFICKKENTSCKDSSYPYRPIFIKSGFEFSLRSGVCSNIRFWILPESIQNMLADEFNNFDEKCSKAYPVGGQEQYRTERNSLTIWSNPRRWEYVEFLIGAFEKIVELLK